MSLVSEAGRFLYVLLSLVIGARLLRLFASNRKLPELLMAACLLCEGFVYNTLQWLTNIPSFPPDRYAAAYDAFAKPWIILSALSVAVFAWKVFHPQSRLAALFVALLALPMVVWVGWGVFPAQTGTPAASPIYLGRTGAMFLSYLWAATATFVHYRNYRRQRKVGLEVDPLQVNRSFFLGVAFSAFAAFWIVSLLAVALGQYDVTVPRTGLLASTGVIKVIGLWLAFLPPQALQKWLEGRADRSAPP